MADFERWNPPAFEPWPAAPLPGAQARGQATGVTGGAQAQLRLQNPEGSLREHIGLLGSGLNPFVPPKGTALEQARPTQPQAPYFEPWQVEQPSPPGAAVPQFQLPQARGGGGMGGPAMPSSMQLGFDVERAQLEAERRAAGYDQATIEAQRQAQLQSNQAMAAQEQRDIEQAREFEARRVNYEADMAKRQTEMDELRADIASTKIDPGAYFSNMSGFSKMLSLFSVALGGFSEGYSGGRLKNVGLQMLDDAIARDVDAQKANLAAKRGKLADAQSVYGLARQKFGDDQAAMDYARARQYEQLANVAKRFQGEARTEELANKAAQLGSMFEDRRNILEQSIKQRTAQANELARARAAQAAAGPSFRQQKEALELEKLGAEVQLAKRKAAGEEPGEMATVVFEGKSYRVPKSQQKELAEMAASADATRTNIEAMKALEASPGFYLPGGSGGEKRARAKQLAGIASAGLARVRSSGFNPSIPIEERAAEDVGGGVPWTTSSSNWRASMDAIVESAAEQARARLQAVGARPAGGESAAPPVKTYPTR